MQIHLIIGIVEKMPATYITLLPIIIVIIGFSLCDGQSSDFKRVCYYTNWSQYRTGNGKFLPENIDPFLCTHLVYAFATLDDVNPNQITHMEWNDETTRWRKGMYERVNDLKFINPKLKTLLAIGGWGQGNRPISKMAASKANRQEFVTTSIQFLRSRGFDGLDIDWEYPGGRGGPPEDKDNLIHLLKELREGFDQEANATGSPKLMLAIAVPVGLDRIIAGYNIMQINKYVDFINIMAYDFHGAWEETTGHHSALFKGSQRETNSQMNLEWAAKYWNQQGASKDKLIIGVPLYGRGYLLQYKYYTGIGARALGGSSAGQYTNEPGLASYYEICMKIKQGAKITWMDDRQTPYLVLKRDWIGYDNPKSVSVKTKWIMQNGFGGIMVWSLDHDDFGGRFCDEGKYPLLRSINSTINSILEMKSIPSTTHIVEVIQDTATRPPSSSKTLEMISSDRTTVRIKSALRKSTEQTPSSHITDVNFSATATKQNKSREPKSSILPITVTKLKMSTEPQSGTITTQKPNQSDLSTTLISLSTDSNSDTVSTHFNEQKKTTESNLERPIPGILSTPLRRQAETMEPNSTILSSSVTNQGESKEQNTTGLSSSGMKHTKSEEQKMSTISTSVTKQEESSEPNPQTLHTTDITMGKSEATSQAFVETMKGDSNSIEPSSDNKRRQTTPLVQDRSTTVDSLSLTTYHSTEMPQTTDKDLSTPSEKLNQGNVLDSNKDKNQLSISKNREIRNDLTSVGIQALLPSTNPTVTDKVILPALGNIGVTSQSSSTKSYEENRNKTMTAALAWTNNTEKEENTKVVPTTPANTKIDDVKNLPNTNEKTMSPNIATTSSADIAITKDKIGSDRSKVSSELKNVNGKNESFTKAEVIRTSIAKTERKTQPSVQDDMIGGRRSNFELVYIDMNTNKENSKNGLKQNNRELSTTNSTNTAKMNSNDTSKLLDVSKTSQRSFSEKNNSAVMNKLLNLTTGTPEINSSLHSDGSAITKIINSNKESITKSNDSTSELSFSKADKVQTASLMATGRKLLQFKGSESQGSGTASDSSKSVGAGVNERRVGSGSGSFSSVLSSLFSVLSEFSEGFGSRNLPRGGQRQRNQVARQESPTVDVIQTDSVTSQQNSQMLARPRPDAPMNGGDKTVGNVQTDLIESRQNISPIRNVPNVRDLNPDVVASRITRRQGQTRLPGQQMEPARVLNGNINRMTNRGRARSAVRNGMSAQEPPVRNRINVNQIRDSFFTRIREREPSLLQLPGFDSPDIGLLESRIMQGNLRSQDISRQGVPQTNTRVRLNLSQQSKPSATLRRQRGNHTRQLQARMISSLIPRRALFQQISSLRGSRNNRNISLAVIPLEGLDQAVQRVVTSGPRFRIGNQSMNGRPVNNVNQATQSGSTIARQSGPAVARQSGPVVAGQPGATVAKQSGPTVARQSGSTVARQNIKTSVDTSQKNIKIDTGSKRTQGQRPQEAPNALLQAAQVQQRMLPQQSIIPLPTVQSAALVPVRNFVIQQQALNQNRGISNFVNAARRRNRLLARNQFIPAPLSAIRLLNPRVAPVVAGTRMIASQRAPISGVTRLLTQQGPAIATGGSLPSTLVIQINPLPSGSSVATGTILNGQHQGQSVDIMRRPLKDTAAEKVKPTVRPVMTTRSSPTVKKEAIQSPLEIINTEPLKNELGVGKTDWMSKRRMNDNRESVNAVSAKGVVPKSEILWKWDV